MSFKQYQVTFDANGQIERVFELPVETAQKRTLFVREETEHDARKKAKALYSLAK